ncbi:MAG: FecR family protein, partial [Fermentimonas sp.]|nr:FecR family protein [Fermentimonas sp.]
MKPHYSSKDFLSDELFLYWRLNPTKEMDLFWTEYITRNDHLKDEFNEAIEEFDKINRLPVSMGLQEIKQPIKQKKIRRRNIIRYAASVAAVALLALITFIYFAENNGLNPEPETASIGEVVQDGSVQLYSGNRVVTLDNNSVLRISEEGKSALIEDHDSDREVHLDNINNKLVVPYGHRSSIKLSDGSMVYLNSGTTIEFPTAFNKKRREITVSGEIFIEVAENKNQPFVIHTD